MFGPRCRYCVDVALQRPTGAARDELLQRIQQTIEPVNIAGLGNAARRNWYPVRAEDLFASADKLQSSRPEIEAMLARCGFSR
jgi:hypothetical protein